MRPTTTTIGVCAAVQLVIITSAWLLTRSFRKLYAIATEQVGLPEPGPGLFSSHFASHGWLSLAFPLLWCAWMIRSIKNDSQRHHIAIHGSGWCVGTTLMVFAVCAWLTSRMMSAALDPRQIPLKPLEESR